MSDSEDFDPIIITLRSVTVFWQDLGLPPRRKMTQKHDDQLAVFWDDNIREWLLDNCKGHINPHDDGVWFADPQDAMLFKITWAGMIPLKL